MEYVDFDLLVERAASGYRARVLSSPVGQASATFDLPFSDLEVENLILRMGQRRSAVRSRGSPQTKAARDFGGRLFESVFDDGMRDLLRGSLMATWQKGAGLRVRLRLADVPELADLPWEYLYDPTARSFFVLSVETPLVRYLDLPYSVLPLPVKPPLRVLAMVSSPSDYPDLDTGQEWLKLQQALDGLERRGLVSLTRLKDASLTALQRQLRRGQYYIFHFVGHGGFDEAEQDGELILEDEQGRGAGQRGTGKANLAAMAGPRRRCRARRGGGIGAGPECARHPRNRGCLAFAQSRLRCVLCHVVWIGDPLVLDGLVLG